MSGRKWLFRLGHIRESLRRIQAFVEGMSFEEFCSDIKTQDAVIRNLEVIGEASRHVPRVGWGERPQRC